MFQSIPDAILKRMQYLEAIDARDRIDGTDRAQRLKQIPPESGKFISILARSVPDGRYIEIGTSAGYSGLWIGLACREMGRTLTTFEVLEEKVKLAEETFRIAGLLDTIQLVHGDGLKGLAGCENISFCFQDADNEIYLDCYELLIPRMVRGGIFVADNVISHKEDLNGMLDHVLNDERVDAVVVPIGKGILLCRKI